MWKNTSQRTTKWTSIWSINTNY